MVTFVDLAARGDALLLQARRRLGTLSAPEAVDAARELAALARACNRILDDVLDARPVTADGTRRDNPATRAAEAARGRARSAAHHLGRAAALDDKPDVPRAASGPTPLLRGAARYLRTAEEFLQTHLAPGAGGARVPKDGAPNPLANGPAAREAVALVGRWSDLLGGIATRMANDVRVPSRPVGRADESVASLLRRAGGCADQASKRIAERIGPPRETQARLAVTPHAGSPTREAPSQRLEKCAKALTELRRDPSVRQGHASATSLRTIAGAAAGVCEHAALLTRQLAVHTAEQPPGIGRTATERLAEAARAFTDAGTAWRGAVWHCRYLNTDATGVTAGARHAMDAATHLGRAVTVHDDWSPGMPPAALRGSDAFAADAAQLGRSMRTLNAIGESLAAVADDHRRTVQNLEKGFRQQKSPHAGDSVGAAQPDVTALVTAYGEASSATRQAVELLLEAGPSRPKSPVALARSSFPTPPQPGEAVAVGEPHTPAALPKAAARRVGGGRS